MNALRRLGAWLEDRTGLGALLRPLLLHPVPPGSKWWYVFGSATLFAFAVQLVTEIALAAFYVPAAGEAYQSVRLLNADASFGRLLRGMHYFGASAMVLLVGVHAVRVYLMAAYKYPREANWVSGVLLLGLTVTMGFTGQLLRWDQNALWSAIVGAEQAARVPLVGGWLAQVFLSGGEIGGATLSRYFMVHVLVAPGLLLALVALHLHLVLRHGISEPPAAGRPVDPRTYRAWYAEMLQREGVPFWPCAAWRDAVFGFLVIVAIVALAGSVGPPALDRPPDISAVEAQPRPDWYLLWYFAVMALMPRAAENALIVLLPLLGISALLALPFLANRGERHWSRRPWAPLLVVFGATCVGILWHAATVEPWSPKFDAAPLPEAVIGPPGGPVRAGGDVFNARGCLYCHALGGHGGTRGPDLTSVGSRRVRDQLLIRIQTGGGDMPAYAGNLTPRELDDVVDFLMYQREP